MLLRPRSDIDSRISTLVDTVAKLTISIDRLATKHDVLSEDQNVLCKKVDKNTDEIRNLQNTGARIDTVSKLAQWGGLFLVGAIFGSWNTLSTKVDNVSGKAETNTQSIIQLKIDSEDTQKQLTDMQKRITENRETIITELRKNASK